jgi:hypothetical protein
VVFAAVVCLCRVCIARVWRARVKSASCPSRVCGRSWWPRSRESVGDRGARVRAQVHAMVVCGQDGACSTVRSGPWPSQSHAVCGC